jgi:hypothetical protein
MQSESQSQLQLQIESQSNHAAHDFFLSEQLLFKHTSAIRTDILSRLVFRALRTQFHMSLSSIPFIVALSYLAAASPANFDDPNIFRLLLTHVENTIIKSTALGKMLIDFDVAQQINIVERILRNKYAIAMATDDSPKQGSDFRTLQISQFDEEIGAPLPYLISMKRVLEKSAQALAKFDFANLREFFAISDQVVTLRISSCGGDAAAPQQKAWLSMKELIRDTNYPAKSHQPQPVATAATFSTAATLVAATPVAATPVAATPVAAASISTVASPQRPLSVAIAVSPSSSSVSIAPTSSSSTFATAAHGTVDPIETDLLAELPATSSPPFSVASNESLSPPVTPAPTLSEADRNASIEVDDLTEDEIMEVDSVSICSSASDSVSSESERTVALQEPLRDLSVSLYTISVLLLVLLLFMLMLMMLMITMMI